MITVDFTVEGASIAAKTPSLASGTAGAVYARFATDGAYTGLAKTAVFRVGKRIFLQPLTEGKCLFPAEVTARAGTVYVGLFATDGTRTLTTVFCGVHFDAGVPTSGERAANYTPGLYEQFAAKFARFEKMRATAKTGEEAAVAVTEQDGGLCLAFTLPRGEKGESYTLTAADRAQIVAAVLEALPAAEEAVF